MCSMSAIAMMDEHEGMQECRKVREEEGGRQADTFAFLGLSKFPEFLLIFSPRLIQRDTAQRGEGQRW
jgi:hypothetical protein